MTESITITPEQDVLLRSIAECICSGTSRWFKATPPADAFAGASQNFVGRLRDLTKLVDDLVRGASGNRFGVRQYSCAIKAEIDLVEAEWHRFPLDSADTMDDLVFTIRFTPEGTQLVPYLFDAAVDLVSASIADGGLGGIVIPNYPAAVHDHSPARIEYM